jgi:hypothetical protein
MSEHAEPSASVVLPGGSGEVALLTAISAALDASPGDLPARVALVRRYIGAAVDAAPGSRKATFKVIAQLIIRDLAQAGSDASAEQP